MLFDDDDPFDTYFDWMLMNDFEYYLYENMRVSIRIDDDLLSVDHEKNSIWIKLDLLRLIQLIDFHQNVFFSMEDQRINVRDIISIVVCMEELMNLTKFYLMDDLLNQS